MNKIIRKRDYLIVYLLSCIGFIFTGYSPILPVFTLVIGAIYLFLLAVEYWVLDIIISGMDNIDARVEWRKQVLSKMGIYNVCHAMIIGLVIVLTAFLDRNWPWVFFLIVFSMIMDALKWIRMINHFPDNI